MRYPPCLGSIKTLPYARWLVLFSDSSLTGNMAKKQKIPTVRTPTRKNQELCLLLAVLAALIMVAGLSLASYMVVGMEKEWSSVTPVFGMFFTCSIVLFVVSSYLTKEELGALRKAGMLGVGGAGGD